MRKSKLAEEQMAYALKQAELGNSVVAKNRIGSKAVNHGAPAGGRQAAFIGRQPRDKA